VEELTVKEFADSFGTTEATFSSLGKEFIKNTNFRFRTIKGEELEGLVLRLLNRIDEDRQVIGADERQEVWNKGWQENLDEFRDSNYDEEKLIPKFIHPNQPFRFKQDYIFPEHPHFELNFVKVYRNWFLENYFPDVQNIYEFGCGTGFNLLAAAKIYPEKGLFGSDFVQSSVDLVNTIAKSKNIPLKGDLFDMINPDSSYQIRQNSGVFTFGSLEQLASKLDNMLEYLIDQKPQLCVHTEPAIELYDSTNLSDYLAIKFQGKRGYSDGLLSKLQKLQDAGKIELIKVKRLYFGSMFMEGYNLFVWKPI